MNYQTITTEGYMGCPGYRGCNYRSWSSDRELKTLLSQEFKNNGIKASIKRNRGGWSYSLTITITANRSDFIAYDGYEVAVNQYRDHDKRFTDEFNKTLNLAYRITNSFNMDEGNSMYDYYNVGFYVSFYVKCKE